MSFFSNPFKLHRAAARYPSYAGRDAGGGPKLPKNMPPAMAEAFMRHFGNKQAPQAAPQAAPQGGLRGMIQGIAARRGQVMGAAPAAPPTATGGMPRMGGGAATPQPRLAGYADGGKVINRKPNGKRC